MMMRPVYNPHAIAAVDPFAKAGLSGYPACRLASLRETGAGNDAAWTIAEAERLGRMKSPEKKAEMAASFSLRRHLIADMTGCLPEQVDLGASEGGAPMLLHPAGWSVSLANKNQHTVAALAEQPAAIGVDIEIVREMDWRPALSITCSDIERTEVLTAPGEDDAKLRAFFRMWTLKEAALKTTGRGFRAGPKAVETPWVILQSPGAGILRAFGEAFDFWTADTGDTIVSLVLKRA